MADFRRITVTYSSPTQRPEQQARTKTFTVFDPDKDLMFVGGGRWLRIRETDGGVSFMWGARTIGVWVEPPIADEPNPTGA
jgi:hypothetical protein